MSNRVPMVSIVVPTYGRKGLELTRGCLAALWDSGCVRANDTDPKKIGMLMPEVIAVDDGSPDDVFEELQQLCMENGVVKLIHSTENTAHFAANCNAGIEQTSGNVVILLNNDVRVLPGCIQTLAQACLSLNFGLAAPKLIYPNTDNYTEQFRDNIQFGGMVYTENTHTPSEHGFFDHALRFQPRFNFAAGRFSEGLLTGACLAINRSTLDMIGLLDERFELTCEDVDYCLRCMLGGLPCVYVGAAEAYHMEGGTRGNTAESKAEHPELNEKERLSLEFFHTKWSMVNLRAFNQQGVWGGVG